MKIEEILKKVLEIPDLVLKKHEHSNKSIIDKITQTFLDNWNSAYNHISDNIRHITSTERSNWNDANSKKHTHENKTILDKINQSSLDNWSDKYTKNEIDNKISQVITDLDWKESVNTFSDIAKTYPKADDGWTVNVKDNNITYRFDGSKWIDISSNSIPLATSSLDGRMSKNDKAKLDGIAVNANNYTHPSSHSASMITEDSTHRFMTDTERNNLNDCNNKKHTHDNKSIIDKITQALLDNWNSAFSHVSDTVKHITSNERNLWNTVSNKVDKASGKQLSTNDYTTDEKNKLSGVATNANNYIHPVNHSADMIVENPNKRFTTDTEKAKWNTVDNKSDNGHTHNYYDLNNKPFIPSKTSELTNDKGYITSSDVDTSQNHIHNNKPVLDKIKQETLDDIDLLKGEVLETNLMPLTTDTTLTKLKDCAGGYVRNMQIRGKTLQNLVLKGNVEKEVKVSYDTLAKYGYMYNLKQNTKYTVVFKSNKATSKTVVINLNGGASGTEIYVNNITSGLNKFTINTGTYVFASLLIYYNRDASASESDFFSISDVMVLEGDYTNKEIPSYFEGIKSTGELEGNKISILTKGKNLYNSEKYPLSQGWISQTTGYVNNADIEWLKTNDFIPILPNTKYNLKIDIPSGNNPGYALYNKNEEFIVGGKNGIFTTPSNVSYLRFTINPSNKDNAMLLHGNETNLDYEPCKVDKTEILIPSPHMGLPNGVSDIVDYDNNERTRNVGKYILDQNTDIVKENELKNQNDTIAFYFFPNNKNIEYTSIISDKFMTAKIEDYRVNDVESISCGRAITIRINRNKLETPDVAGFKKWLQANPTTVYYQLAEPKTEKLSIKDTLQSFENGYIQLDNAITPTTSLEYSTNIMSIVPSLVENQNKIIDKFYNHNHDDRYYTENEIDAKINSKANSSHIHTKSQITDFPTSLPASGGNADTVDGKHASEFASSIHTHDDRYYTESEMNTKLAEKSNSNHTHNYAGSSSVGGSANTAVKLATARNINGVAFDGSSNITVADSTKLPIAGGTVTGRTLFNQGISVKNINGGAGTSGYMYLAQIKITGNYQNQPITFNIHQRERFGTIIIKFNSQNTSDPTLAYINKIGSSEFNAYICKSGISTWDLYLQKSEGYDSIDIIGFSKGDYMSSTLITWQSSTVTSLPSGYTIASVGYLDIAATKANQDGNGNNITSTYVKKGMTWNELEGV